MPFSMLHAAVFQNGIVYLFLLLALLFAPQASSMSVGLFSSGLAAVKVDSDSSVPRQIMCWRTEGRMEAED